MTFLQKIKQNLERFHLVLLILLAGFLNIYKLWDLGYGNTYYAAAIKSMSGSLSNFFFVSLDSTGFVSIDKPPFSLWLDTIFAKVFGFSGFSILLPHALAGVLVTFLIYKITRDSFQNSHSLQAKISASLASLVVTLSPVNVAVYRNNTPDSLLLVFILLTILFVMKYFRNPKLSTIILAGVMLGFGFNTKMLQAYLLLPAVVGTILLFANTSWLNRLKAIGVFLVSTFVVSALWITIVDLIPASLRPFVGSSTGNSAWNLAFGYNGTERFSGENSVGAGMGFNLGDKGLQRLFTGEMGTQIGWLLASVILFTVFFTIKYRKVLWRAFRERAVINSAQFLTVLSCIYLVVGFGFFSLASFFHSYYLNVLSVPIALLFGQLWYEFQASQFKNKILLAIFGVSIGVQSWLIYTAKYAEYLIWIIGILFLASAGALLFTKNQALQKFSTAIIAVSLLITPLVWSNYTTQAAATNTAIFIGGPQVAGSNPLFGGRGNNNSECQIGNPNSGFGGNLRQRGQRQPTIPGQFGNRSGQQGGQSGQNQIPTSTGSRSMFGNQKADSKLVEYLQANNQNEKYFLAVDSSMQATSYILDYDIGNIMDLGGFSSKDKILTLEQFQQKVKDGKVRFYYGGGGIGNDLGLESNTDFNLTTNPIGANTSNPFPHFNPNCIPGGNLNGNPNLVADNNNPGESARGFGAGSANTDIDNWIKSNCRQVSSFSGLYDCQGSVK